MRLTCFVLSFVLQIIIQRISCYSVETVVTEGPKYNYVAKWASEKLDFKTHSVMVHKEKAETSTHLFDQWIEGETASGDKQKCHVVINLAGKSLSLSEKTCQAAKPDPDFSEIIQWLKKHKTSINTQAIVQHSKQSLSDRLVFNLDIKDNDNKCYGVVEYLKTVQKFYVKTNLCNIDHLNVNLKEVLNVLMGKVSMTDIKISQHVEVHYKDSAVYTVQLQGLSYSNKDKICSVVLECGKSSGKCTALSKTCNKHVNLKVDLKVALQWIEGKIDVQILNVIEKKVINLQDKIVFQIKFEGRQQKNVEKQICTTNVEYLAADSKFKLVTKTCTKVEVPVKVIPTIEDVVLWVTKKRKIEVIKVVKKSQENTQDKVVYYLLLKIKTKKQVEETSYTVIEYLKATKKYVLKLQMDGLYEINKKYELIGNLIAQQLQLVGTKVMTHTEITLHGRTVFTIQLQGKDVSGIDQFCFSITECINNINKCTIKAHECSIHSFKESLDKVIAFISHKLDINVNKIISQKVKPTSKDEVLYDLKLDVSKGFLNSKNSVFHISDKTSTSEIDTDAISEGKNHKDSIFIDSVSDGTSHKKGISVETISSGTSNNESVTVGDISSGQSDIFNIALKYSPLTNQYKFQKLQFEKKKAGLGDDFEKIKKLLINQLKVKETQIIGHTSSEVKSKVVHNVWLQKKKDVCMVMIEGVSIVQNECASKSEQITAVTAPKAAVTGHIEATAISQTNVEIPTYKQVALWAAKETKVEISKIVAHKETLTSEGIEFSLSYLTGDKSCYTLVLFKKADNSLYVMANICSASLCSSTQTQVSVSSIKTSTTILREQKCSLTPITLF